ncbi:MAG TPA: dTMP kinase [bacterium]|jgi:dTMP kinase|nr:dTMP kinase [bacterium]
MQNKGLFITFEGPEGAGKTTQIKRLAALLEKYGISFIITREPGGSRLSTHLRRWILNKLEYKLTNETELFLFLADRSQHVKEVIKPALEKGKVVLCDRYTDSTLAYQGGGRGFDMGMLDNMNRLAADNLKPDITLLFDLPVEAGLKRVLGRGKGKDRMEREKLDFHRRVREAFLLIAKKDRKRILVLDASQSAELVYQQMLEKLIHRLPAPQVNLPVKGRHV